MGGPVARWAEETDQNPPRLERYDRWGHDVSQVVMPASFTQSKRAVLDAQQALRTDARAAKVSSGLALFASNYLLNQADIGMGCALGTGGGMVESLVSAYAPADVRDHVLAKFESGEWAGETAQLLTERTGGSDLGALETTAARAGDAWLLNGFKWFASNCAGEAFVVLAKPEGAPDSSRGIANFLVLRTRRDGSRNGVRVRRLKDKLGTRSVASGEVEFVDAEAFLLSGEPSGDSGPVRRQGTGPDDGADQRRASRYRAVRPGQRASRAGRVALLRAAAPRIRRGADRQATDAPQAGRVDRRRRSRAGNGFRRHRSKPTIASRAACASASRCRSPNSRRAGWGSPRPPTRSKSTAATAISRRGRWPGFCATRK